MSGTRLGGRGNWRTERYGTNRMNAERNSSLVPNRGGTTRSKPTSSCWDEMETRGWLLVRATKKTALTRTAATMQVSEITTTHWFLAERITVGSKAKRCRSLA